MPEEAINPAVKLVRSQAAEAERLAALVRSYKMVFGGEAEKRTDDQLRVWEDIERAGFFKYSTAKATPGGIVDPHQTSLNEGKRMLFLYILANVTHVAPKTEQQQQK